MRKYLRELARAFGWMYLLNRSQDGGAIGAVATAAVANRLRKGS